MLKDQILTLPEGRSVGFAEYGDRHGYPVVVCHGTPGSRLMLQFADGPARDLGLRVIIPDRPGYGLSDAKPEGSLVGWTEDLRALADHLGFEAFAVIGVSGGVPYALAAAYALPLRVTHLQVISGLAPLTQKDVLSHLDSRQRTMTRAVRGGSLLLQSVLKMASGQLSQLPDKLLQRVVRLAPGVNGPLSVNLVAQQAMAESFREAFRHGGGGLAGDLALFSRSWGFAISRVTVQAQLWHGEEDLVVPVGMGHYLAGRLPRCDATFIPDAGHYWVVEHVEEILTALRRRLPNSLLSSTPAMALSPCGHPCR